MATTKHITDFTREEMLAAVEHGPDGLAVEIYAEFQVVFIGYVDGGGQ